MLVYVLLPLGFSDDRHVDGEGLAAAIDAPPATARQTPRAFMHALQRRAQSDMKRIVLPEGTEPRVLKAAADITRRGLAYITLLGNPDAVQVCSKRCFLRAHLLITLKPCMPNRTFSIRVPRHVFEAHAHSRCSPTATKCVQNSILA